MKDFVDQIQKASITEQDVAKGLDELVNMCYLASKNAGWWTNLETGQSLHRNKGEMLMLIVSEISEAMEAARKQLMDDKLPNRPGLEVELADAVIRICDFCGGFNLDLSGAILEKLDYNARRPDHKLENRKKSGGKKW